MRGQEKDQEARTRTNALAAMILPRRDPELLDGARFLACNATCRALVRWPPFQTTKPPGAHVSCSPVSPLSPFPLASQPRYLLQVLYICRTARAVTHGLIASPTCELGAPLDEMALTRASVDDQRLVQDLFLTSPDRTSPFAK